MIVIVISEIWGLVWVRFVFFFDFFLLLFDVFFLLVKSLSKGRFFWRILFAKSSPNTIIVDGFIVYLVVWTPITILQRKKREFQASQLEFQRISNCSNFERENVATQPTRGIVYHSSFFYVSLYENQKKNLERVNVDGSREWWTGKVHEKTVGKGIVYFFLCVEYLFEIVVTKTHFISRRSLRIWISKCLSKLEVL